MSRATRAQLCAANLRHNAARVRDLAPDAQIMACVKADGYGHGIRWAAQTLRGLVDGFAVACMEEALTLRDAAIEDPVLLLEGPQTPDEVDTAREQRLTLCISEAHHIDWLEHRQERGALSCWLKVDSGMHRLGFAPGEALAAFARLQAVARPEPATVLCTHFAQADLRAEGGCRPQLAAFDTVAERIAAPQSCANSAAIFDEPRSHRAWVRPGYMLYGGSPFADAGPGELDLRPVMEFSAAVIAIRDVPTGDGVGYAGRWRAPRPSRVATIAAGYGDGYPRHAPDGTPVLIEGQRLPLVGRVSMDMITVDVTDAPQVQVGSRATLWGEDPGVDEVATHAGTIGYQLLAAMPPRVPRLPIT
jgi:alanine racemase